jgi:uncharacterized protein YecT (DUF1311 family)
MLFFRDGNKSKGATPRQNPPAIDAATAFFYARYGPLLGGDVKLTLAFAFLAAAAPALARGAECNNPMDQGTMNRCAEDDWRASDAKLNAAYGRLTAALDDENYKTKLRAAQRAWITFRDTECTYETAENEGGSIHPLVYFGCLKRLTDERTKALDTHLACWKDADQCGM